MQNSASHTKIGRSSLGAVTLNTLVPVGLAAGVVGMAFTLGTWKGHYERRIENLEESAKQLAFLQSQVMILRQDVEVIKARGK